MNDHDLARALTSAAAGIRPTANPSRLRAGMVRFDRLRRMRILGVAGALAVVGGLGVFAALPDDTSTPARVTDRPPEDPEQGAPDLQPIAMDEPSTESSTTSVPGHDGGAGGDTDPAHLTAAPRSARSPTPAVVVTTTIPATTTTTTTTTAPATSAPPTTTTTVAAFAASARYGSCGEDPPYDEYEGHARPGTTVTITSPWSSPATVVAGDDGSWSLRVEFPTAPVGRLFTVTASDGTASVGLDFIRTA